jgi:hypothetical protein
MQHLRNAGPFVVRTVAFWIVLALAPTALAQRYLDSDPRSPNFQQWNSQQNEQAQQRQRQQEATEKQRAEESARIFGEGLSTFMANQKKLEERLAHDVERDRAMFLKTPPLPPQKNLLLGQWRLSMPKKRKTDNPLADLNAMMAGGTCEAVFGEGIWDFRPQALYGIDAGVGESKLTDVAYHGNEGIVGVIPRMGKLFVFKVVGPDRVQELTSTRIGVDPCNFVRVRASGQASASPPAAGAATTTAPPAAVGRAPQSPPAQMAAAAPTRSTPTRPSPEVCRNTLLDQLGSVGVNQVRAMSDVRFKEAAIEGKVPNSNNLRLDLRGSACDDPRIKAMLYDFDAQGMLQSITYVWDRPAGPPPAPIFAERAKTLALLHPGLPAPQSAGRLQGDTSLGRLVLQDMPERNLLLEAYSARK